ncbi:recombinase family protein [Phenylobacterium soli]|uniref:Recombinase family protein n=1 Tax=Phenylobacterium soli TaxID=2170551 RepID=A0A328AJ56_9CAUL|nr:recombinase family protein [Phenylobacterium soli]RAK54649.1 recombinase family protein [Phenylobacterium soli]
MLRIGYVRLSDTDHSDAAAALRDMGCQVVRVEEDAAPEARPTLTSILDFIGQGDELVALRLQHLGRSPRAILEVVERLDARGAALITAEPPVTTCGERGETLRAVLAALAALEPPEPARRRPRAPAQQILALQRAGVGPVEIARRLGVSRMTVWRKLRALETCDSDS